MQYCFTNWPGYPCLASPSHAISYDPTFLQVASGLQVCWERTNFVHHPSKSATPTFRRLSLSSTLPPSLHQQRSHSISLMSSEPCRPFPSPSVVGTTGACSNVTSADTGLSKWAHGGLEQSTMVSVIGRRGDRVETDGSMHRATVDRQLPSLLDKEEGTVHIHVCVL